jgi:tRNA1(Val) A37 N6-methylase TrmN6
VIRIITGDCRDVLKTLPADAVPCVVLDPFGGAGTVGLVADRLQRDAILIELNPTYADMARRRVTKDGGLFAAVTT